MPRWAEAWFSAWRHRHEPALYAQRRCEVRKSQRTGFAGSGGRHRVADLLGVDHRHLHQIRDPDHARRQPRRRRHSSAARSGQPAARKAQQMANGPGRDPPPPVLDRTAERLRKRPEILDRRREVVEHLFGSIKQWMHQGAFLMRGLANVRAEFSLTALAYTLRRALNILGVEAMTAAVAA